jgi:hypothetical protein
MEQFIEKKTGSYAETLEAIGLSSLLRELGYPRVKITDEGSHFLVHSPVDVPPEQWKEPVAPGYPYIWERSKEAEPQVSGLLDYESEKEKRDAAKKIGKKGKAKLETQDIDVGAEARPEIHNATILASMRKGWNADRDLSKWIHAHPEETHRWVRFALGVFNGTPDAVPEISNTQMLNPISGKGVHASKTEIRSSGSIPGHLVNPFSEWMKLRGLWSGMLLYRTDDDFKFFVLEPADVSPTEIDAVRTELQKMNLWGGVRLDIHAALHCTAILIRHSDAVQTAEGPIRLLGRRPRAVISGLRHTFFQSLGTAAALMNDAFLPLPDWFMIENKSDAAAYLSIIEESIGKGGCLSSLQEKNSDDGRILQQYREWLLTGRLFDLLDFHHQFALHLIQRFSRRDWARPFGTENFSNLLIKGYGNDMTHIIQDEGFQSVARAVRNATLYALTIPNSQREVRFGLAQKWKQKIKAGDADFTAVVADFVQEYNWETAHRLEGKGHLVTTGELDSLVRLIQEKHANLVGSLLLAYGFARAPKIEPVQAENIRAQS